MTNVHVLCQDLGELPSSFPGMEKLSPAVVFLMGCRNFQQYCCTYRSLLDPRQFCPFCSAELERRGHNPMAESKNWMLLQNEFPHKNTRQMWLLTPKRHLVDPSELSAADWESIGALFEFCLEQLRIKGGGMMFRFGDPRLNVGTVGHLHLNVIEPICGQEYRPPFAKNMSEHAEDYQRMMYFRNALIEKGGRPWLFSEAGIKETQPAAT